MSPSPCSSAVVTDSAADLPTELLEAYAIEAVPAILVSDGESVPDGRGLAREALADPARGSRPA